MARSRLTQKKRQQPEEEPQEDDDEEYLRIRECPAQIRKGVIVCCNMGATKKTDYSMALCNHCKCLWHVECIKPSEYVWWCTAGR